MDTKILATYTTGDGNETEITLVHNVKDGYFVVGLESISNPSLNCKIGHNSEYDARKLFSDTVADNILC